MKITKQCSECGGREIYTTEGQVTKTTRDLLPRIGGLLDPPKIEVYVCGNCGYYQMFVSQEHIDQIKEKYIPYE